MASNARVCDDCDESLAGHSHSHICAWDGRELCCYCWVSDEHSQGVCRFYVVEETIATSARLLDISLIEDKPPIVEYAQEGDIPF